MDHFIKNLSSRPMTSRGGCSIKSKIKLEMATTLPLNYCASASGDLGLSDVEPDDGNSLDLISSTKAIDITLPVDTNAVGREFTSTPVLTTSSSETPILGLTQDVTVTDVNLTTERNEHGAPDTEMGNGTMSKRQNGKLVIKQNPSSTPKKPFKCPLCESCFTSKSNRDQHQYIHTGEKPFQCQFCNSKFAHKRDKIRHERIHTGEKPFQCQFCNSRFAQKSNKTCHERTHTNEKPFICEHCNKCFRRKSHLTAHHSTHTNEKPFSCPVCHKSFSHSWNLVRHTRTYK